MEPTRIRRFTFPNLLTLGNLTCGSLAVIRVLAYGDLQTAFWLVVAAALFDFADGFAARLLHISSPIGVELDSLSDVVSFGLVPALVLFTLYREGGSCWGLSDGVGYLTLLVALAAALRLAKFNVDPTQREEFEGMPTPAGAIFVVAAGWLASAGRIAPEREWVVLAALVLAWLLNSPIRMFALKFHGFGWRGNRLRYGFLVGSLAALCAAGIAAIPFIVAAYAAVSLVRQLGCRTECR